MIMFYTEYTTTNQTEYTTTDQTHFQSSERMIQICCCLLKDENFRKNGMTSPEKLMQSKTVISNSGLLFLHYEFVLKRFPCHYGQQFEIESIHKIEGISLHMLNMILCEEEHTSIARTSTSNWWDDQYTEWCYNGR